MNQLKNVLVGIAFGILALVGWLGILRSPKAVVTMNPSASCADHATQTLTNIGATWRIDASALFHESYVEMGVCKKCGALTDVLRASDGMYSHFPYGQMALPITDPSNALTQIYARGFKEGKEKGRNENWKGILIANWTMSNGLTRWEDWPTQALAKLDGVVSHHGRLVIACSNELRTIAEFEIPPDSTIVLQGDNGWEDK